MELELTKLHGSANDYLFVDCTERPLERADEIARIVSDRRRGIGSDGLILICTPDHASEADFRMEMYNADGSRGKMCGNGIRGLGKYVADRGMATGSSVRVDTDSGVKTLELDRQNGKVANVTVDMGPPILEARDIPADADGQILDQALEVDGRVWTVSCVSMGNPHCITFDEDPDPLDLPTLGPPFERHRFFPEGVNTEFVRVDSPTHLTMRVWERGSGETMACGTGACAVLVAAALTNRAERKATVTLLGGDLEIEYAESQTVFMTGPAEEVFTTRVSINLDTPSQLLRAV